MIDIYARAGIVSTGDVVPEILVDKIMGPHKGNGADMLISVSKSSLPLLLPLIVSHCVLGCCVMMADGHATAGPFFLGFALEYLGKSCPVIIASPSPPPPADQSR